MPSRRPLLRSACRPSVSITILAGLVLSAGMLTASASQPATAAKAAPAPRPSPAVAQQFLYNAGAAAIGGVIRLIGDKPPEAPLVTRAPAFLTRSGGKSVSEIKDFHYGREGKVEVLSVGHAVSDIEGTKNAQGCYVARTRSLVERLSVLDRLKADLVEVELATTHCLDAGRDATFRTLRCTISNLSIDGVPVATPCSDYFSRERTLPAIVAEHRGGKGTLVGPDGARLAFGAAMAPQKLAPAAFEDRVVMTSLFPRIGEKELRALEKTNQDKARHFELLPGNGIYVPNFGKVYFGPFLMRRHEYRLTMLHLVLGSPVEGTVDIGGEYGDGSGYP